MLTLEQMRRAVAQVKATPKQPVVMVDGVPCYEVPWPTRSSGIDPPEVARAKNLLARNLVDNLAAVVTKRLPAVKRAKKPAHAAPPKKQ